MMIVEGLAPRTFLLQSVFSIQSFQSAHFKAAFRLGALWFLLLAVLSGGRQSIARFI